MTDLQYDLCNNQVVYRSKIVNHPAYANPVVMVEQGWKDGQTVVWSGEIKYSEIKE